MTLRSIFAFLNKRCNTKYKNLAAALDYDPSYISKLINGRYVLSDRLFEDFAAQCADYYAGRLKNDPEPQALYEEIEGPEPPNEAVFWYLDAEERAQIDKQKLARFLEKKLCEAYRNLLIENELAQAPAEPLSIAGEKALSFWGGDAVRDALQNELINQLKPNKERSLLLMAAVSLKSVEPIIYSFHNSPLSDTKAGLRPPRRTRFFLQYPAQEKIEELMQPKTLATIGLNAMNSFRKWTFSVYELPDNYCEAEGVAVDRAFTFHFLKNRSGQLQAAYLSRSEKLAEMFRSNLLRFQTPSALLLESDRIENLVVPGTISKICYAPKTYMVSKAFAGLFLGPQMTERYAQDLGANFLHEFEQTMYGIRINNKDFDLHIITSYTAVIEFIETGHLSFLGRNIKLSIEERRDYLDNLCRRLLEDRRIKYHLLHQWKFPGTQGECHLFGITNGHASLFIDGDPDVPQRLGITVHDEDLQQALMEYFDDWSKQAYVDPENREELVRLIRATAEYAWGSG